MRRRSRQRGEGGTDISAPFVCVTKHCDYGAEVGHDLGAAGYRLTFDLMIRDQPSYLRELRKAGLETFLSADTDSYPGVDWQAVRADPSDETLYVGDVAEAIEEYAARYAGLCTYIGAGLNEWDGGGDESAGISAPVVNRITGLWRAAFPDHPRLVASSSISGDPANVAELDLSLVNMIDAHLYGRTPPGWTGDPMFGPIRDKIAEYRAWFPDKALCLSEIGLGTDDGQRQAEYCRLMMSNLIQRHDVQMVAWYAVQNWRDYGLLDNDGQRKAAYYQFRGAASLWDGSGRVGVEPEADPRYKFVFGFARIAELYPELVGYPLENENVLQPGVAVDQLTSNGTLLYVAPGLHVFTDRNTRMRYKWSREDLGII